MPFRLSGEGFIFIYGTIATTNLLVLPQLLLKKVFLQKNGFNQTQFADLSDPQYQKDASLWWLCLLASNHVPSLFTILIWGPVTDKIGRKRSAIFVAFIFSLQALIYLINAHYIDAQPGYLLFGSVLSSLYGDIQGAMLLGYACLADETTQNVDSRTLRMIFIEVSFSLSALIAGVISGLILQNAGFVYVFLFTFNLNFVLFVYSLAFLRNRSYVKKEGEPLLQQSSNKVVSYSGPSTEPENDERHADGPGISYNPVYYLKQTLKSFTPCSVVIPMLFVLGFSLASMLGEVAVQVFYLKAKPFQLSPSFIGYYVAYQAILRGIVSILFTFLASYWWKFSDYTLIYIGQVSQALCYLFVGFARSKLTVFLAQLPGGLMILTVTAIRSILTKKTTLGNYGDILAALEVSDVFFDLFTAAAVLGTYNCTAYIYSGIAYFLLSGFAVLALFFAGVAHYMDK